MRRSINKDVENESPIGGMKI